MFKAKCSVRKHISSLLSIILILGVILGLFAIHNAYDSAIAQMYLTNKNDIAIVITSMEKNIEAMEKDLNSIVAKYWYSPDSRFYEDSIQVYNLVTDLKNVRLLNDDISFVFYIKDQDYCWLGSGQYLLSYEERDVVKNEIATGKFTPEDSRQIVFKEINDRGFMCYAIYNERMDSYIGVMYSIESLFNSYSLVNSEFNTFFVDAKGDFWGSDTLGEQIELYDAMESNNFYLNKNVGVSSNSTTYNFSLVRTIDIFKVFKGISSSSYIFIGMLLLILGLNPIIGVIINRKVYVPLERISHAMGEIKNENLDYRMTVAEKTDEFELVKDGFNTMADEIQNLRIKSYEDEINSLQIEATNLRLQVSPHMLQNSLNMIYSLSLSKNFEVIQQFVPALSDYFRYSLEKHDSFVLVSDEMKFIDDYLKIQKIRFPNKLSYVYDVDDELMNYQIPPLLIQNFVENTVKHGLNLDEITEIIILMKKNENQLQISIVDTGTGIEEQVLKKLLENEAYKDANGEHIGIYNCRRRLDMLYDGKAVLNISSVKNQGTQVWISLPIYEEVE